MIWFGPKYNCKISSYMAIILGCYYVVNLILDPIWIILAFYCKSFGFRIILFYTACFETFYKRMNKPIIYNNIIGGIANTKSPK